MARKFQADDFREYSIDYADPFRQVESIEKEIAVVERALDKLRQEEVIPHKNYPQELFARHRRAVRRLFEVPWTAITPRMERLIYAVNAIIQPQRMIAAGVFCGFTFICNAGSGVGPGKCYDAEELLGVEIDSGEAERAERNVRRLDNTGTARIVPADAVEVVGDREDQIDLLYLDADGGEDRGKDIYLDILRAGYDKMPPGAVVMAHNSFNCKRRLQRYLTFVRSPDKFTASVNVLLDSEGLEISMK